MTIQTRLGGSDNNTYEESRHAPMWRTRLGYTFFSSGGGLNGKPETTVNQSYVSDDSNQHNSWYARVL